MYDSDPECLDPVPELGTKLDPELPDLGKLYGSVEKKSRRFIPVPVLPPNVSISMDGKCYYCYCEEYVNILHQVLLCYSVYCSQTN